MASSVEATVREVLGSSGDQDVLNYVVDVLADEEFEFGEDAAEAFDALGPLLVGGGCAPDDAAAHELCRRLQSILRASSNGVGSMNDSFRALDGGPILLDHLNQVTLHPSDTFDGKSVIQGVFREGDADNDDFSLMSERDAAKIRRQKEKTERAQRAAYEAHRAAAAEALAGAQVEVVRNQGGPTVRDVHLSNLCVSNGGAELITDCDLLLAYGRRYGLVGRNGTGKSTLLRALSARQVPGIPVNCQVLHVEQEVAGGDATVMETVLACDTERTALLAEEAEILRALDSHGNPSEGGCNGEQGRTADARGQGDDRHNENAKTSTTDDDVSNAKQRREEEDEEEETDLTARLNRVSHRLLEIDAAGAEARAAAILAGLSFDSEMQQRPTRSLSGGWRMRVALARALFVQPDLLLLDEPTNHLDLHAVLWLQDYLLKWSRTLVVVSHAREFLNAVCTDMLHLHSRKLTAYRGNYDSFVKTMQERMRCERAAADALVARRAHVQAFVDKFRYNAKRASLVQSRIKALERMAEVSMVEDDPEYRFVFPTPPDPVGPSLLSFTDVSFAYPGGPELFTNLNFGIDMQSRLSIIGANGCGKTTLLNLIAGKLEPTKGRVERSPKARIAIFSQHHVDGMDLALTPLQYMAQCFPDAKEPVHRSHLASFGVPADLASQTMFTLSGGQKSRVALAKITWNKPHLLLLDEPSNHLDIDAVDALIAGLAGFEGGVLMVSHDQYLIEASVDELWAVEGGKVHVFHGDFEQYKQLLRKASK